MRTRPDTTRVATFNATFDDTVTHLFDDTLDSVLEQAVLAHCARRVVDTDILGPHTTVWAAGLWATTTGKPLLATWDTPRLSLTPPTRWDTRTASGTPATPGAPRVVALTSAQVHDLHLRYDTARWTLSSVVDDAARHEAWKFFDWWRWCLGEAHRHPVAVPGVDDVEDDLDAVVLAATPLVDDIIAIVCAPDPPWATSSSLVWGVVHDKVRARLRHLFSISGHAMMILATARDLRTTDPHTIRGAYLARGRRPPSVDLIRATLTPPPSTLRLRDLS